MCASITPRYMAVHAALESRQARPPIILPDRILRELGTVNPPICGRPAEGHGGEPSDVEWHSLSATPPTASPAPGLLASYGRPKFAFASRYAITLSILIGAMLLGGLAAVIGSAIFRGGNSEVARQKSSNQALSATSDAADKPVVVARLAKAVGCRWTNAKTVLPVGSELLAGQKLDLATGEAEIVFRSGARLLCGLGFSAVRRCWKSNRPAASGCCWDGSPRGRRLRRPMASPCIPARHA